MAKAFYTQDEAKDALNTDDDGLKEHVHEGRLTEYRDGANLMYKGSQVEQLASNLGSGDDIGMSDTGGPIGLADSAGSMGGIALDDEDDSAGSAVTPAASVGGASVMAVEDPSGGSRGGSRGGSSLLGDDVGLSGDDTGSFAVTDTTAGGSAAGRSTAGASQSGITIFEDDDDDIDPSAQTSIGSAGSSDQVNLEGIGSGSGLLDLTQEPDDTSFGAETFDEIMPEGSVAGGTVSGLAAEDDSPIDTAVAPAGTRAVGTYYEPHDPTAPIFGGLAGGAAAALLLGLLALGLAALRADPGFLDFFMADGDGAGVNTGVVLGVLAGLPILGAIIGFVGGKMGQNA